MLNISYNNSKTINTPTAKPIFHVLAFYRCFQNKPFFIPIHFVIMCEIFGHNEEEHCLNNYFFLLVNFA